MARSRLTTWCLLGVALWLTGCATASEGDPPPPDAFVPVDSGPRDGPARDVAPDSAPPRPDHTLPPPDHTLPPPDHTTPPPDTVAPLRKVVISELMANPAAVSDSKGEWFELHNAGTVTVDLHGWTIKDQDTDTHTIAAPGGGLKLTPGARVVLGIEMNILTNGGVKVSYKYGGGWQLANSADEILLYDDKMTLMDKVVWDTSKGWVIPAGASLSRKSSGLDGLKPASWCAETKPWSGSKGDKGSPAAKPGCP